MNEIKIAAADGQRRREKFALVIANYNRATYLDRAIRSCLTQLTIGSAAQVIVIDDGSTDSSIEVCKEFADTICLYEAEENRGVAWASNKGLELACAEYWMRVDSDDYLSNLACQIMGAILDANEQIDFVYCDHYRVNEFGKRIELVRLNSREALLDHGAGVLFRASALRAIGGYDESLRNAEDYDLLLRLFESGSRGFYLPVPLYRYYIHGQNISLNKERDAYKEQIRRKHEI